jgi:hypothetical protein
MPGSASGIMTDNLTRVSETTSTILRNKFHVLRQNRPAIKSSAIGSKLGALALPSTRKLAQERRMARTDKTKRTAINSRSFSVPGGHSGGQSPPMGSR